MKFFKIVVGLVLIICSCEQKIKRYYDEEGSLEREIFYFDSGDSIITEYKPNGDTLKKGCFKEGRLIQSTVYTSNVRFVSSFYENGLKIKEVTYHVDGSVQCIYRILDGKLEGETICYYPSGQKRLLANFREGINTGRYIQYYSNGVIRCSSEDVENDYVLVFDSLGNLIDSKRMEISKAPDFE